MEQKSCQKIHLKFLYKHSKKQLYLILEMNCLPSYNDLPSIGRFRFNMIFCSLLCRVVTVVHTIASKLISRFVRRSSWKGQHILTCSRKKNTSAINKLFLWSSLNKQQSANWHRSWFALSHHGKYTCTSRVIAVCVEYLWKIMFS